ncbi:MAG: hypothetical protein ACI4YB_00305 [Oscillospiraceae bacterium]
MKRIIIAVAAISAIILSSCANQKENAAPIETDVDFGTLATTEESVTSISSETTASVIETVTSEILQTETTASVEKTDEETIETVVSEISQTETVTAFSETEAKNNDASPETTLTGKWMEENRLYTYEFDDNGKVTIDIGSCKISGKYELDGEYDLILYLDWQGEYAGDEPLPYGFDLERTDNGYRMNYHPMDEGGYMPFEPLTLVSGFSSALWSEESFVLTAYKELPVVQQKDVLGFWDVDGEMILLFTDDAVYSADDRGLYALDDTIIKDGTWDIDGETAYVSSDGEKIVLNASYETKIMTKLDPKSSPITGVFSVKSDDEVIAELWLKNGVGIVNSEASPTAASVSIDGVNITIKMGDKTISGVFCPCRNDSYYPDWDKFGLYKDGELPCSYYLISERDEISMQFDFLTLYNSKFNEWYKKEK